MDFVEIGLTAAYAVLFAVTVGFLLWRVTWHRRRRSAAVHSLLLAVDELEHKARKGDARAEVLSLACVAAFSILASGNTIARAFDRHCGTSPGLSSSSRSGSGDCSGWVTSAIGLFCVVAGYAPLVAAHSHMCVSWSAKLSRRGVVPVPLRRTVAVVSAAVALFLVCSAAALSALVAVRKDFRSASVWEVALLEASYFVGPLSIAVLSVAVWIFTLLNRGPENSALRTALFTSVTIVAIVGAALRPLFVFGVLRVPRIWDDSALFACNSALVLLLLPVSAISSTPPIVVLPPDHVTTFRGRVSINSDYGPEARPLMQN